jgi:hypothetical protein
MQDKVIEVASVPRRHRAFPKGFSHKTRSVPGIELEPTFYFPFLQSVFQPPKIPILEGIYLGRCFPLRRSSCLQIPISARALLTVDRRLPHDLEIDSSPTSAYCFQHRSCSLELSSTVFGLLW